MSVSSKEESNPDKYYYWSTVENGYPGGITLYDMSEKILEITVPNIHPGGNQLSVTPGSRNVSSSSGSTTFSVSSNINWSVSDNVSWLSITPTSGSNNGTLTATYSSNSSTSSRSGTITISGGGINKYVTVNQEGQGGGISGFTYLGDYNGHPYYLSDNGAYWNTAKQVCENNGGHLVTITSSGENSFVKQAFGSSTTNGFWIGLTDEASEGHFVWINGESLTYTNWKTGQPDNANGNQDYVLMQSDGEWDDGFYGNAFQYVLEIE